MLRDGSKIVIDCWFGKVRALSCNYDVRNFSSLSLFVLDGVYSSLIYKIIEMPMNPKIQEEFKT